MKKPRKRRELVSFQVARVFPPDDELAIDLLRLMAFHDDLAFIGDFMRASMKPPSRPIAQRVAASRWFFLQRLFSAVVAELVKVFHNLTKESRFEELRQALDTGGREASDVLLAMPFDENDEVFGVLYRARNRAAFHFDPGEFADAIRRLMNHHGNDAESSFVFEPEPGTGRRGRTYYMLADQIAIEISYGLPAAGEAPGEHKALPAAIDLHAALSAFLESAVTAYCSLRGIPAEVFKRTDED